MNYWPQILANIEVKAKDKWQQNQVIQQKIEEAQAEIAGNGRVFVRASGTEPLIRVMLEGKDEALLRKWEKILSDIISEELN